MTRWTSGVMAFGVVLALAGGARAEDMARGQGRAQKGGQVSEADRSFLMEAAKGGMAEVELGQLAKQRATRDDVRAFGQRMVKDHGKANDELKKIAKRSDVSLPADMGEEHRAAKEKLSQASGLEFDRQYMSHMVEDHEKDVAAFEREASEGSNASVKRFAQKTVPTLRDHLRQAREIDDRMKATQNAQR